MIMMVVALTPGFPKLPFIMIGAGLMVFVNYAKKKEAVRAENDSIATEANNIAAADETSPEEKNIQDFLKVDRVVIEIGAGLISLVEPKRGNGIAARIKSLRENMANQYGFWIPQARIRDNLEMGVHEYRFIICGREVGRGDLMVDRNLAINPGDIKTDIDGVATKDPAFNLPALWIEESNRRRAEVLGFTVVDAPTVLTTHLGECLRALAHELLSREDLQKLLEKLKEHAPTTVEDIRKETVQQGQLHQILVNLLSEGVPITSLEKIVESAIYFGPQSKSTYELTEKVRSSIGHLICEAFKGIDGRVRVMVCDPKLEHHMRQASNGTTVVLSPKSLEKFVAKLRTVWETAHIKNEPVALLVDSAIRQPLRNTIFRSANEISVLAYNEIPTNLVIDAKAVLKFDDVIVQDDSFDQFDLNSMIENDNT
ncbi:MAG: FHIPEP family type III secretion protein, partial [Planctomycetota bacterium]